MEGRGEGEGATIAEEGARVFGDDVAGVVGLLREALPALDDALLRARSTPPSRRAAQNRAW